MQNLPDYGFLGVLLRRRSLQSTPSMDAFLTFAQNWYGFTLFVGILMLIGGGHLLVEGSVAIAKRLGVSTLVIGLTIVAFSTSSPELAFNVIASANGHGDLCLGNIFGSNIANIGLVLGIGAIICNLPVTGQIIRWEFPWLVGATALVGGVTGFGFLNRIWAIVLLCIFCFVMVMWYKLGRKESKIAKQSEDQVSDTHASAFAEWAILIFGLLLLGLGGKATELGAVSAARGFGISELVIGGTIVAIATSLPEIVTTVLAALKKHHDLAVGNVVGSNLFNILFVLPTTVLVSPISSPENTWVYIGSMIAITVLAWYLTMDAKVKYKEGWVLVGLYCCFIVGSTIWIVSSGT